MRVVADVGFVALTLLLILWLTLHWGILPHIQQWRIPIESRVGQLLGRPVHIGAIQVRTGRWVPSLELRDVVLDGTDRRPALTLPLVLVTISPASVLWLQPRLDQLVIDGARLDVRRSADGRVRVAGFELGGPGGATGDDHAAEWLLSQHELVIRNATLRWTDEQRDVAPLELTEVRAVLRNRGRRHEFRLDATPPPDRGSRFVVTAQLRQSPGTAAVDWRGWSGTAYADVPRADLHALGRHVMLPFRVDEAVGALRGWIDVRQGEPVALTLDMALRNVDLRLAPDLEPLQLDQLRGRLSATASGDTRTLSLANLTFQTTDGLVWPRGDMALAWTAPPGQPVSGGRLSVQRIDIGLMAQITGRLPVGKVVRDLLTDLDPKGRLTGLAASWQGSIDAPQHFHATGTLGGLSLAAHPAARHDQLGRPGVHGATVVFDVSESGGSARLDIADGSIELPGVLDDPHLPFDRLGADLAWTIGPAVFEGGPAQIGVDVRRAQFANADVQGDLTASWRTGPAAAAAAAEVADATTRRFPGQLELDAHLGQMDARRLARYLPLGLPNDTRDYLARALQAGSLNDTRIRVRGDLAEFPFFRGHPASGEFQFASRIEAARFAFAPGEPTAPSRWPALTEVGIDLLVDRDVLTLRNGHALLGGVRLDGLHAVVGLGKAPLLIIDTTTAGPITPMLKFIDTTPVGGWIGGALAKTTATGTANLAVHLEVPLLKTDAARVRGELDLADNDLRMTTGGPLLTAAHGRVNFDNDGFSVADGHGQVYGGALAFAGGSRPDGTIRFDGQGTATAEALRQAAELGPVQRIATSLQGQAAYSGSLGFVHGQLDLDLRSDLVGMASTLPPPLAKSAPAAVPLRYATLVDRPAAGRFDSLIFDLGDRVHASFRRALGGVDPTVLQGAIGVGVGVGAPAPRPAVGVSATIELPTAVADDWAALAARLAGPSSTTVPGAGAGAKTGAADARKSSLPELAAGDAASPYLPDTATLRIKELIVGHQRVANLSANVSRQGVAWHAQVNADALVGAIDYTAAAVPRRVAGDSAGAAAAGVPAGRVAARLTRLALPLPTATVTRAGQSGAAASSAQAGSAAPVTAAPEPAPGTLPALDVAIDEFSWRGQKLGRVKVEAANVAGPRGPEWRLTNLDVTTPEARLFGTGQWAAAPAGRAARRHGELSFRLEMADSGALLDRLGIVGAVRGGKGAVSGHIGWLGSPFDIDYPSLDGQLNLTIGAGQFLRVEPGAARLLGVLSLQSLPRRLLLDFRDVFDKGFAFDSVTGDLTIDHGVARTDNLKIRGVPALVELTGSADIEHETQDLRLVVKPQISAGTAALAYSVINPVIGLGVLVGQALLNSPLSAAGTREFRLSGSWDKPDVERVARSVGDDAAAAAGVAPIAPRPTTPRR